MFVKKTVYLDLMEILSDKKHTKEEKERILSKIYNVGVTIRADSVIYDDEPNELYNLYNVEEETFNSMNEDELIEIFNL